jgi:hypothetical protein
MKRLLVCLVFALVAGCGDNKKSTAPIPPFPDEKQEAPAEKKPGDPGFN